MPGTAGPSGRAYGPGNTEQALEDLLQEDCVVSAGPKTCMTLKSKLVPVIAAISFVLPWAVRPLAQAADPITDAAAYEIYAALLPHLWATQSKDPMVLQRETEVWSWCESSGVEQDPEARIIESDFRNQNSRVRTLEAALKIDLSYRLIPRADILADDARLALRYPGVWQRRPGSMEYAAVSAVGFNAAKTKAIVQVRLRGLGNYYFMERRDGKWVAVRGCTWVN